MQTDESREVNRKNLEGMEIAGTQRCECGTENENARKFCRECGSQLVRSCAQCGFENLLPDKFCGECGIKIEGANIPITIPQPVKTEQSELKQVTVFFSDVEGYTEMVDKLDVEEVQEIMSRIFNAVAKVVVRYGGHIEKFIGDAVMVLFGAPTSNEDDPIRAIKAAMEIHQIVEDMNSEFGQKLDRQLAMHTGINTGIVITNAIELEANKERLLGDSINIASRLTNLAKGGEIIVGKNTWYQSATHFEFEPLGAQTVKGKTHPVEAFKVNAVLDRPADETRLSDLRSEMVGRDKELATLNDQMTRLIEHKKGTVCCITGEAGTGKSRLVQEFKECLDSGRIEWFEGHAHAYAQNIPYFPLIDLLNQAWQIDENMPKEQIRQKIESEIKLLFDGHEDVSIYIKSLYGLSDLKEQEAGPDLWKSRLSETVRKIFQAMAETKPKVICFKDLHWADASTVDLLRDVLSDPSVKGLFVCVYRPPFTLFTSDKSRPLGEAYRQIKLKPLRPADVKAMTASLLKTEQASSELISLIQEKSEGNPFYLEQVIHVLIDTKSLVQTSGSWQLVKKVNEINMPSTITGVISSRLDYLQQEQKRLLQEASVIGRVFLYDILKKTTKFEDNLDNFLAELEEHDLIRSRAVEPEIEYMFKDALTRDVVYNGMLKKQRQKLHARVGKIFEVLFEDRLPEFYETLAFHYKQSDITSKAVDYLVKSGDKSLRKYAITEAHQYFGEAYKLLENKKDRKRKENKELIDILIQWALVLFYRHDLKLLKSLIQDNMEMVESLGDKDRLGMIYGWLGAALWEEKEFEDSYIYSHQALRLGQKTGNKHLIAHAYAWISCASIDLDLSREALEAGRKSLELLSGMESENFLYYFSLSGRLVRSIFNQSDNLPNRINTTRKSPGVSEKKKFNKWN